LGIGGGIITRKLLFAVLLISSLSLAGITGASAANVGTVQTQTDNNSTVQEKLNTPADNLDSTNESAKMQNDTCSNLKTNQTADNTPKISIEATVQTTANATKPAGSNQAQSVKTAVANKTQSTVKGAQKPEAAAGETKNITSFTVSQINDAASKVKSYVETNHKLPSYVTIGTTQVQMPAFLKLITTGLLQLNSGKTTPVTLQTVNAPAKPSESIKSGSISKADYLDLAKRVNTFIDSNGVLPNYATSTLGKLRYESVIYMFSKVLDFQKTNSRLPSYVTVNAWSTITKPVLTQAKTVYITSDNINGVKTDTNRINAIVNGLKALGLTAINAGLGTNTHYSVLQNSKVPANALIVNVYGGACAGTIYEMGQSYYKKVVGNKKVFCVWIPPAVNITGLAWLPRSHDDNFSPSSFTGLAHPDQYLLNNGYEYIYSGDLNAIITAIYKEATE
jgi:hypothetical protein